MKPQHHPEKFSTFHDDNETNNTTISAAQSFLLALDRLAIPHGEPIARDSHLGLTAPLSDLLAEGCPLDSPYLLELSLGNGSINLGVTLNFFRGTDPVVGWTRALTPVIPGFGPAAMIGQLVQHDEQLRTAVSDAAGRLIKPALEADGGV